MRSVYLVCYDVSDAKRLRQTHKKMCGFGDPLQYSVFRCELSPTEKQLLQESLWEILNLDQDRVMLVNVGPTGGRGDQSVEFWGRAPVSVPTHGAAIV